MSSLPPSHYHPQLVDSRLRIIAETLLEVLYDTTLELDTALDDGYTRGTATFGRQKNAIIQLCQSGKHDWLALKHAGMDVTFSIDEIPCRFFSDDPANPKKPGYWKRNDADTLLFPIETGRPEVFRFVVEKSNSMNQDPEVYFLGYDANQTEVFRWHFASSTPVLVSTDEALPKEVELPPARAKVPEIEKQKDQASGEKNTPNG